MISFLCPWNSPQYIFFSDSVPQLLYYSYIPIIFLTLFFTFFIYKNNKTITSKLILISGIFFVFWILNILIQWASNNPNEQMFAWSMTAILELPIYILSYYFLKTFITNSDISLREKFLLSLFFVPTLFLLPTRYNIESFYLTPDDCGGYNGVLWNYIYFIEALIIFWITFVTSRKVSLEKNKIEKKKKTIFLIATILFLSIFWLTNFFGELTKTYEINLIGPIGMVLFVGLLTFLIVQFKAFNIKLIGAQALVWGLVILIGSQLFYIKEIPISVLIIIITTFIIASILGFFLVDSVKKEVALREQLEIANTGQANLIHIMNHQIKGYLSTGKNIFAELLTDDYGKIPEEAKSIIGSGLDNADKGTKYVTAILRGESAENGTLPYDMQLIDFKNLVSTVVLKEKEIAEKKGLKFSFEVGAGSYNMTGDMSHLGEAVRDLIDNSIFYTPTGNISINLSVNDGKILFKVKDTGVGIKEEDKPKLFKAGGVGSDSIKINTNSSGYGLAFVKGVIEKHRGRVWLESAGAGKGSTFYIELPVR